MTDPFRLEEAAELMQKLHLIAQELPTVDPKFERAKNRVEAAYSAIEAKLMEGFIDAFKNGEVSLWMTYDSAKTNWDLWFIL